MASRQQLRILAKIKSSLHNSLTCHHFPSYRRREPAISELKSDAVDPAHQQKLRVAAAAVKKIAPLLSSKSIVGVGTGSTTNCFIDLLAEIKHTFDAAVSSSDASTHRLRNLGIPVLDLNAAPGVDVYVDGADELNDAKQLIKGGGAALTREKIVASGAERFICIADASKRVTRLGGYPLPVEIIPMARSVVARQLVALGGRPEWREGVVTDNGNWILDVHELHIEQPEAMESRINDLPGVVCNGLFALTPADCVLLATPDEIIEIE